MSPDESSVELKRPSDESEDAPSQGKKPRTGEDPLVAANALASFAGPSTEEEGPAAADASPPSEDPPPPPDKEEEVIAQQVSDDNDAGTGSAASASDSAAQIASAAARAIQEAMNTVKQEQHVLAEREEAVKRQRSKAARFCADSRARRRLRTMIFEQSADPATQQMRIAQMQQLQQSQIRSQQLQNGVDGARATGPIAVQTAQFATPLSYLQTDQAGAARAPFFPDHAGTGLSLQAQLLASHGGASWNPFTSASLPVASPLTQTPLAHSSLGFSATSAFAASLGVAAAPAAALPSLSTPGEFGALANGTSVFRSPVILDGSGNPATAPAVAAADLPRASAARPASQEEAGTGEAATPATAAAYPATGHDISASSLFAGQLPSAGRPAVLPAWS